MEKLTNGKHTTLLRKSVIYGQKRLIRLAPDRIKLFSHVTLGQKKYFLMFLLMFFLKNGLTSLNIELVTVSK
jgi:hypothetical protein